MGVFSQLQGHGQKAWIIKAYTVKSAHSWCRGIPSAFRGDAEVHRLSLHPCVSLVFPRGVCLGKRARRGPPARLSTDPYEDKCHQTAFTINHALDHSALTFAPIHRLMGIFFNWPPDLPEVKSTFFSHPLGMQLLIILDQWFSGELFSGIT
ncbi:hypothetical protein HJG60_012087 [Phyllostomus discolor]|uniref:Uncharacterized protein n=1 Tax=Phyllostomus discolor TaxID=89673 RepID=A0A833ZJF2_9CHIR|nr:hypothetical protein HJG60_012087 [Phyllostomus discolor]